MKWINGETWASKKYRLGNWHRWFAWHPVTIGYKNMPDGKVRGVKFWLGFLERKGYLVKYIDGNYWSWDYREIVKDNPEKMERPIEPPKEN